MSYLRTVGVVAVVEQMDLPSYIMRSTDSQLVSTAKAGLLYLGVARSADIIGALCCAK